MTRHPKLGAVERRTGMCDAAGKESWSYDALGRVLTSSRTTSGVTKNTSYTYNLDGSLATVSYPSGRTVTYAYNAAARPLSAVDTPNTINYALSASYAPQGALASVVLGQSASFTGINLNQAYNSRLQPTTIRAWSTSGVALDLSYGFNLGTANNGNVAQIANNRNTDRTQSFTYDELNRIKTAQTQAALGPHAWGLEFGYDIWANLLSARVTQGNPPMLGLSVNSNNRISGYCYDAAGNLLAEAAPPCPVPTYTYDAENRMTTAAGVMYTYDGDGKRVQKSTGKLYWYGMGSDPITETDAAGNNAVEYVFFGGKRLARRDASGSVNYYFADHLGSSRVVTSATGQVLDDSDFYPFGGDRPVLSASGNTYKFTAKERDSESGLDNFGARYDSSSLGRFMSSDSTAYVKPINPQNWNLYAYALNNPLLYIDPTGHTVSLANCKDQNQCAALLAKAAQLPKGVTAEVDKKGNLVLKGDLNQIKGGNAARLLQLVQSDKTANFWIGDKAPGLSSKTQPVGGGLSGTTTQGYNQNFAVVQADPSKVDSGDLGGVFLNPDGSTTAGQIPGTDIEEAAAHELLGHVWADLIGGESAGTQGNMKEALIAEDRVRNTDPSRGLKIRHQDSPQLIKATDLPRITNPGSQP